MFDFAPERTLIIYDEFANNLSRKTVEGGGTTEDRKENIRKLLNFFPVIAEDNQGAMVELDVNQVLTIPKTIKAQEVVRRGFMSNLLFQNISGIFASEGAKEILEQLNPVAPGKTVPKNTDEKIDTKDIEIDDNNEVVIDEDIIISTTNANFGQKVYSDINDNLDNAVKNEKNHLSEIVEKSFKDNTTDILKNIAKENGLTMKKAENIINNNAKVIAREVEVLEESTKIKQNEAEIEYKKSLVEAKHDEEKISQAKSIFENRKQELKDELVAKVTTTVENKTKDLTLKSTETILKEAENKKKNTVEDDVRARLRGFARTIPSFLMAYGESSTTLDTFDTFINNEVFKEVTGITLEQFRTLRDKYNFFDPIVFNESVQEFLRKRSELSNYFDDNQEEDIFDYIPPQQTNQIFTPKKVVIAMIDQLEKDNPEQFKDPTKTFLDPYMKSGLYLAEIIKRLYAGLEKIIPDNDERLKHILENQVYGFAPSEIIYNIARNYIFGFDVNSNTISDSHIVHLDTTPYVKGKIEMTLEEKSDQLFGGDNNEI